MGSKLITFSSCELPRYNLSIKDKKFISLSKIQLFLEIMEINSSVKVKGILYKSIGL